MDVSNTDNLTSCIYLIAEQLYTNTPFNYSTIEQINLYIPVIEPDDTSILNATQPSSSQKNHEKDKEKN